MNTPICDFVKNYKQQNTLRLHMPGHKGEGILGAENLDITEINGADSLFDASGIIYESEKNASAIFGSRTFYSAEGSSLCIRAMLYLIIQNRTDTNSRPLIMAARNVHKTFISAAALLDFDVSWIYPEDGEAYLSCSLDAKKVEGAILSAKTKPLALYITSPDYLGHITDIAEVSKVCKKYGVILAVDNAHGAYLKFMTPSAHPIDLGADICCDSAHKTLPVLTGGAYLHISNSAPKAFLQNAKNALSLFASTSPSYLILQSLDHANTYISENYKEKLMAFSLQAKKLKDSLIENGYHLIGDEALKLTIDAKAYGYTGYEIEAVLSSFDITCEFCDSDFVVMMLGADMKKEDMEKIYLALTSINKKTPRKDKAPRLFIADKSMSIRSAMFSKCKKLPIDECEKKILASPSVGCPPAVPIVVCGEVISEDAINLFRYYNISSCYVVDE